MAWREVWEKQIPTKLVRNSLSGYILRTMRASHKTIFNDILVSHQQKRPWVLSDNAEDGKLWFPECSLVLTERKI